MDEASGDQAAHDQAAHDQAPQDGVWDDEAKAAFHLSLRARGVRDLAVLRATEQVPRRRFVEARHAGLVARDLAVPLGGGQTASPAWVTAGLFEALAVESGQRVLQVGAGSGYGTAILAQLGTELVAVERVRSLAEKASACLDALGVGAQVRWADALDGGEGRYDRIVVHACCDAVPAALLSRLADGGRLVFVRPDGAGQAIVQVDAAGHDCAVRPLPSGRLAPLRRGLLDL